MNKILVTGGAGFIGSNFARYWTKKYPEDELIIYDALTYAGNPANIDGVQNTTLVKGDILDIGEVSEILKSGVKTIVHFAAESHVDRSIHDPDSFIRTNINGTHSLLRAAKENWIDNGLVEGHRFHHVSTDEVYGSLEPDAPAFMETTAYAPNSPYSASKAASDHLVRSYHHTYGLLTTTSNCSNNYGPYQFPEKLIPLFIINALHGKPLPIYGDGMNVRDWLYVEDHCHGIDLVLKKGIPGEVYNIGGGEEVPNIKIIETICEQIDAIFELKPELKARFPKAKPSSGGKTAELRTWIKDRPGHDRRYAIDYTKSKNKLGYAPQHNFKDRFHQTLSWYLENEDWWNSVLDGSYRSWIEQNYNS